MNKDAVRRMIDTLRTLGDAYSDMIDIWNEDWDTFEDANDALDPITKQWVTNSLDEMGVHFWAWELAAELEDRLSKNESLKESSEDDALANEEIERILKRVTNNFTKRSDSVTTSYEEEKNAAKQILKKYYKVVEVSDGRRGPGEEMSWVISYANPIAGRKTEDYKNEIQVVRSEDDDDMWRTWGGTNDDELDPEFLYRINHPKYPNPAYNIENQYKNARIVKNEALEPGNDEISLAINAIKTGNMDHDEETEYVTEYPCYVFGQPNRGLYIKIQDLESSTTAFKTPYADRPRYLVQLDRQPRVASHSWGRIWVDGELLRQFSGPKNVVRKDMIAYLKSLSDGNYTESLKGRKR